MLEGIWVSDLGLVLVDYPQDSKDVIQFQDANLLRIVVSPSDFFCDHVLNLLIKLHINHLLLQDFWIVKVKLSHIGIDVFVYFLALKHHQNLSLTPHLVHYIVDDVGEENELTSEPECKVDQDLFHLVELV